MFRRDVAYLLGSPGSPPPAMRGAPRLWTPAELASLTYDGDPSRLALSHGATIATLANALGGSLALSSTSTGTRPLFDNTTHTANGWPVVALTSSPVTELYTTGGPVFGSSPFELFMVARYASTTGNNAAFPSIVTVGTVETASPLGSFALIGARSGHSFLGSYDGAHLNYVSPSADIDTSWHILHLAYDGTEVWARRDGMLLGSGPETLSSMPAGFGFARWLNSDTMADAYVARLLIFAAESANLSMSLLAQLVQYLGIRYNITLPDLIAAVGDSVTWAAYSDSYTGANPGNPTSGIGVDHSSAYVFQLAAQAGFSGWTYATLDDATPGFTSAQILAGMVSQFSASPLRRNNLAVVFAGINDQLQSVAAATTLTNIASIYSTLLGAGYQAVVVCTVFPWVGMSSASLATLNAGIRSTYPHVCDLGALSSLLAGLSVVGGTWEGTYDDVLRCASGATGHLTAAGEGVAAGELAPILLPLKR